MNALRSANPDLELKRACGNRLGLLTRRTGKKHKIHVPPKPAFLVPAILEALFTSKYGAVTQVVPYEAEFACADPENCSTEDVILTGDTDLIIHKPNGRIVFFYNVYHSVHKNGQEFLQARYHDSRKFAKSVGTNDLTALAFFLNEDPFRQIKEAAELAKTLFSDEMQVQKLSAFREIYSDSLKQPLHEVSSNAKFSSTLQRLDPRVSELVHGLLSNYIGGRHQADPWPEARIFLPNFLEDPMRASAWRPSHDLRCLGYTLLYLTFPGRAIILEVDRRGTRPVATPIECYSHQKCGVMMNDLVLAIWSLLEKFPKEPVVHGWRAFALLSVLRWERENSKSVPDSSRILQLIRCESKRLGWPDLHLNAQVEGVLYSLRILAQSLDVRLAWPADARDIGNLTELPIRRLSDCFKTLPSLQELSSLSGDVLNIGSCEELIEHHFKQHCLEAEDSQNRGEAWKTKKRKKIGASKQKTPSFKTGCADQENMFSLLENHTA